MQMDFKRLVMFQSTLKIDSKYCYFPTYIINSTHD